MNADRKWPRMNAAGQIATDEHRWTPINKEQKKTSGATARRPSEGCAVVSRTAIRSVRVLSVLFALSERQISVGGASRLRQSFGGQAPPRVNPRPSHLSRAGTARLQLAALRRLAPPRDRHLSIETADERGSETATDGRRWTQRTREHRFPECLVFQGPFWRPSSPLGEEIVKVERETQLEVFPERQYSGVPDAAPPHAFKPDCYLAPELSLVLQKQLSLRPPPT